jgi:hypothetical protein
MVHTDNHFCRGAIRLGVPPGSHYAVAVMALATLAYSRRLP